MKVLMEPKKEIFTKVSVGCNGTSGAATEQRASQPFGDSAAW